MGCVTVLYRHSVIKLFIYTDIVRIDGLYNWAIHTQYVFMVYISVLYIDNKYNEYTVFKNGLFVCAKVTQCV